MSATTQIIHKEWSDALRNRWIGGYALLVAILGFAAALVGVRSTGAMALQMFGRTTATLTNLALLLAPLVALVVGASSIAGERDRGTLERLLSLPITSSELVSGKFSGLLLSLIAATIFGFAPAGVMIGIVAGPTSLLTFLLFPFITIVLIAAMLGLGFVVSVACRTGVKALGGAVLLWFGFVLLYDLLLIGSLTAIELPPPVLAMLLLANPVDAARVLVVLLLEPDLYALGPAGIFLVSTFGRLGTGALLGGTLAVWSVVPIFAARWRFDRVLYRNDSSDAKAMKALTALAISAPAVRNVID